MHLRCGDQDSPLHRDSLQGLHHGDVLVTAGGSGGSGACGEGGVGLVTGAGGSYLVPGGVSIMRTSLSPQATSVRNCLWSVECSSVVTGPVSSVAVSLQVQCQV